MPIISKDNYIVIYRLGDSESREFAEYYAAKHNLDFSSPSGVEFGGSGLWEVDGQLVGINCSGTEILDNQDVFFTEVISPLQDAIINSVGLGEMDIWGVVVGYNVPGGFYHPGISSLISSDNPSGTFNELDVISTTSRLSSALVRVGSADFLDLDKKRLNRLYNRSVFQRFNEDDAGHAIIVSRIDAPTLSKAKRFAGNSDKIIQQGKVKGIFYLDPYSDRAGPTADAYTDILTDFGDNFLSKLGLETFITTFVDPYIDATIPYVQNDSFVWQWFADRATSDFFRETPSIRILFFNADYDSALTVRDSSTKTWSYLALSGGYGAVIGSMSEPGNDAYPNPTSFFDALLRGATLGEAFLFSVPTLDWTITLFGDPLVTMAFPGKLEDKEEFEEVLDEDKTWLSLTKDLGRVAAHLLSKEDELNDIRNEIVNTNNALVEISLLGLSDDLYNLHNEEVKTSEIRSFVDDIFGYPLKKFRYRGLSDQFPSLDSYLTQKGFKVSALLVGISSDAEISASNLYEEGFWEFEFEIEDNALSFVNYHFLLEVSTDSSFASSSDNIMDRDSADLLNWSFETRKDAFVPMPFSGVPASKIGRRVRYTRRKDDLTGLDESLTRGTTYYFRVMQYNTLTDEQYRPRIFSDIIFT